MKLGFSRTIFNTGALKTRDEHMGTEEDIKFVLIKRERERDGGSTCCNGLIHLRRLINYKEADLPSRNRQLRKSTRGSTLEEDQRE